MCTKTTIKIEYAKRTRRVLHHIEVLNFQYITKIFRVLAEFQFSSELSKA